MGCLTIHLLHRFPSLSALNENRNTFRFALEPGPLRGGRLEKMKGKLKWAVGQCMVGEFVMVNRM